MERKFNHLMTFESYTANEEFNPFKKDDWKSAGNAVRRGAGFLNPEEEKEEGMKLVLTHPVRKKLYYQFLKENPIKADKYAQFWGKTGGDGNPVWNGKEFVDKAHYYAPSGAIGAGN
jgi:hypothetical protein